MAAKDLTVTEEWIRERLQLHHNVLADVRTLCLPGNIEGKISHLGISLKNFVRLKTLDLSYNALVSVSGLEHLKALERLNLYFNKISAFQDVTTLCRLRSLRELDLRLNPVVKKHPEYRLHLVHALCQLRELDDCPVRDRERKAAIMHFTSDAELGSKPSTRSIPSSSDQRASKSRLAAVNRLTKSLTQQLSRGGNEEITMNQISQWNRVQTSPCPAAQKEPLSPLVIEIPDEVIYLVNDNDSDSYLQKQDCVKPAFRQSQNIDGSGVKPSSQPCRKGSLPNGGPAGPASNRPRVTFADCYAKGPHSIHPSPASQEKKASQLRIPAQAVFTPDPRASLAPPDGDGQQASSHQASVASAAGQSGLETGDLSPAAHRMASQSEEGEGRPEQEATAPQKGSYRKPLDALLTMVREHWTTGNTDPQQYKTFFTRAVQVVSVMERELASGEHETQSLREEVQALNTQTQAREAKHQAQIQQLYGQLEKAHSSIGRLDEELRSVLEENVCLQKQIIILEQNILESRINRVSKYTGATDSGSG